MTATPDITATRLVELDRLDISVWMNRHGWFWARRAELQRVTGPDDAHKADISGPFHTAQAAAANAIAVQRFSAAKTNHRNDEAA